MDYSHLNDLVVGRRFLSNGSPLNVVKYAPRTFGEIVTDHHLHPSGATSHHRFYVRMLEVYLHSREEDDKLLSKRLNPEEIRLLSENALDRECLLNAMRVIRRESGDSSLDEIDPEKHYNGE